MTKKEEKPQPKEPIYKLTGTASFPFLAYTAAKEKQYPEDKYKVDGQIAESDLDAENFATDTLEMARKWFEDDEIELSEACPSIKFLNEDLDEENDKYAKYKKDKVRVRAKSTAKQQPTVYDVDQTVLTEEKDILKISNGCKINMYVAPYCYGDQKKYLAWAKKLAATESAKAKTPAEEKKKLQLIKKLLDEKPVFGVALGLQAVQFLEATSGKAKMQEKVASMLDDTEVSASDVDYGDDEDGDDETVDLS